MKNFLLTILMCGFASPAFAEPITIDPMLIAAFQDVNLINQIDPFKANSIDYIAPLLDTDEDPIPINLIQGFQYVDFTKITNNRFTLTTKTSLHFQKSNQVEYSCKFDVYASVIPRAFRKINKTFKKIPVVPAQTTNLMDSTKVYESPSTYRFTIQTYSCVKHVITADKKN